MDSIDNDADYDIAINNVSCTVHLGCHINLKRVALNGYNVEHHTGRVTMKLRKPKVTAFVWGCGKILCVGAKSEEQARIGTRRIARIIQKQGFKVKLRQMRIVNVNASCTVPFHIKLYGFARRYRDSFYEPELHSAASYKVPDLKARLFIYATGSIVVMAPTVNHVNKAIQHIYPLVAEFRRELTAADEKVRAQKRMLMQQRLLFR